MPAEVIDSLCVKDLVIGISDHSGAAAVSGAIKVSGAKLWVSVGPAAGKWEVVTST